MAAFWTVATSGPVTRKRNDLQPLEPDEALETIYLPEGFEVDLIAAEPLTKDPVAFDWDLNGRLWVVEMADYPYGMDGNGQAGGRIRVLEDRDADGIMDYSSLFAEGLNFPNGLLIWRDGVIVTAAPDILFLQDTDGDGKAILKYHNGSRGRQPAVASQWITMGAERLGIRCFNWTSE